MKLQFLQQFNIGRWIDDLEDEHRIAEELNQLNQLNHINQDDMESKSLVAYSHMLRMDTLRHHLFTFLKDNPNGTYEAWVAELHRITASE
jgi:hypothetical protein